MISHFETNCHVFDLTVVKLERTPVGSQVFCSKPLLKCTIRKSCLAL